jgi:serine phosphatase RsbU (regulator of sigma subunit)/anti-sigma regulatory factor (Ser/Thr protein kinase)
VAETGEEIELDAARTTAAADADVASGPAARLEDVERLTDVALGYLSLEELLLELLDRIRLALRVDTVAVLLLDDERGVLVARAAKGIEEEVRQGVQVPLARGFAGRVAAEDRPIIIPDLDRFEVVNPLLRRKGIRSMLGVPLHVEGHVIGVMHVGTLHLHTFRDADVRMLQLAADRAALAIDNARLSEQRAVTEVMQRTLLPAEFPEIPGLRFSAKYLPAGTGIRIGGDWYDVFELPDGRIGFVIGDVVGRGVVAASVMAEVRTALRAYLLEGHDLARAMSLLNDLLSQMGRHRSATAAIFALDMEGATLAGVNAGHLPAVLIRAGEEPRLAGTASGLPLGLRPDRTYVVDTMPFPMGSTLLLYTDGLVERRGESLDEGLERLIDAARAASDPAPGFAELIYNELVEERSLEDDVAVLAIESSPIGPRLELTLPATARVLAGMRRTLGRWLMGQGVSSDERFDVTVAVSEAAGNAIEHAYGPSEANFELVGERAAGEVRVRISDTGTWRPVRPEGRGRGLLLMRSLADSVEIDRSEAGTSVTLIKRLRQTR